jgi:hypothetical protein
MGYEGVNIDRYMAPSIATRTTNALLQPPPPPLAHPKARTDRGETQGEEPPLAGSNVVDSTPRQEPEKIPRATTSHPNQRRVKHPAHPPARPHAHSSSQHPAAINGTSLPDWHPINNPRGTTRPTRLILLADANANPNANANAYANVNANAKAQERTCALGGKPKRQGLTGWCRAQDV